MHTQLAFWRSEERNSKSHSWLSGGPNFVSKKNPSRGSWKPLVDICFWDFVFSLPDGHLCVLIFVAKMSRRFYPTIFRHDVSPRTPRHPLFRHVSAPHPSATNSPVIYQRASQGRWQWWTVRRLLVLPVHAQSEECRGKRLRFSSQ